MRFSILSLALLLPSILNAAGLVPCNGPDCNACHIISLGQNILNWLILFSIIVAGLIFAIGGLKMVMAGGNPGEISAAKGMFTNVIVGIIILLSAWLIIDTVMKYFVNESKIGPWNQIQCVGALPPVSLPTTPGGVTPGPSTPSPTAGCISCSTIPSNIPTNGNACSGGGSCQINAAMASRLTSLQQAGVDGWRVSEAWPPAGYSTSDPSGIHAAACHGTATCVDVSFNQNSPSGQTVQGFISSASSNNLTAVYEVQTQARQQELQSAGVSNVIVVPTINREHFSVYMCDIDSTPNACK